MWHFAYGSNLNKRDLDAWCDEKGLPRLNLKDKTWKLAALHDYALVFDCFSRRRNCVAANIQPSQGELVRGVAFELTQDEFTTITRKEGAPKTYTEIIVELGLEYGSTLRARTFRCRLGTEHPGSLPSRPYLTLIIEGATDHGLDPAWLAKLRTFPTT